MIRPSSLPRALACPASLVDDGPRYDPPSEASAAGTAAHRCLEAIAQGREPDPVMEAARVGADPDEVEALSRMIARAWRQLAPQIGSEIACEMPLAGALCEGTADIVALDRDDAGVSRVTILDLKTGRVERDHSAQLGAYALAWRDMYGMPTSGTITTAAIWLRSDSLDVRAWTTPDLDGLAERIRDAAGHPSRHAPGEHCHFCPRRLRCASLVEHQRAGALAISEMPGEVSRVTLGALHERARALEGAIERYAAALRIALRDGPIQLPDGRRLELRERILERIKPREAWAILESAVGLDAIAGAVKLSKTEIMRAVGESAPKGQKGRVQVALAESLRQAGALETEIQLRIETVRAEKEQK